MMAVSKLKGVKQCPECWKKPSNTEEGAAGTDKIEMSEWDILEELGL